MPDHIVLAPFSRHPALSNLPGVHRQAIEATMTEVSSLGQWNSRKGIFLVAAPSFLPPCFLDLGMNQVSGF